MDDQLAIKKIQALLHDPPEKPIILGRIGHERRAKQIMERLIDEAAIPDDVRNADHIASAADRINLPKQEDFTTDFLKNPIIVHPLSGKAFDLKSLAQLELGQITKAVDGAVSVLFDKYGNNNQLLYLSLWRELLDQLKVNPKKNLVLGSYGNFFPQIQESLTIRSGNIKG